MRKRIREQARKDGCVCVCVREREIDVVVLNICMLCCCLL